MNAAELTAKQVQVQCVMNLIAVVGASIATRSQALKFAAGVAGAHQVRFEKGYVADPIYHVFWYPNGPPTEEELEEHRRSRLVQKTTDHEKKQNLKADTSASHIENRLQQHRANQKLTKSTESKKQQMLHDFGKGALTEHWLLYSASEALRKRGFRVYIPEHYGRQYPRESIAESWLANHKYPGSKVQIEVILDMKMFDIRCRGGRCYEWTATYREQCATCPSRDCQLPGHTPINASKRPVKVKR